MKEPLSKTLMEIVLMEIDEVRTRPLNSSRERRLAELRNELEELEKWTQIKAA